MGDASILCRVWDIKQAKRFLAEEQSIFSFLSKLMLDIAKESPSVADEVSFILTPRRFYMTMPNREFLELNELDWVIECAKDLLLSGAEKCEPTGQP